MLDHSAIVGSADNRKKTALYEAANRGHSDICNTLINFGALKISQQEINMEGRHFVLICAKGSSDDSYLHFSKDLWWIMKTFKFSLIK